MSSLQISDFRFQIELGAQVFRDDDEVSPRSVLRASLVFTAKRLRRRAQGCFNPEKYEEESQPQRGCGKCGYVFVAQPLPG